MDLLGIALTVFGGAAIVGGAGVIFYNNIAKGTRELLKEQNEELRNENRDLKEQTAALKAENSTLKAQNKTLAGLATQTPAIEKLTETIMQQQTTLDKSNGAIIASLSEVASKLAGLTKALTAKVDGGRK